MDILSTMSDPSLPLTTQDYDEYGDPLKDQAIYDAIKKYCPYFNIKSQVKQSAIQHDSSSALFNSVV